MVIYWKRHGTIFYSDCSQNWCAPDSWNSGHPVVFKGFGRDENLQLINGAQIVLGKVSNSHRAICACGTH